MSPPIDLGAAGLTVQGVDPEEAASSDDAATDDNGANGASAGGRRRRRGGRGRNRRERGAEDGTTVMSESALAADEFAANASASSQGDPDDDGAMSRVEAPESSALVSSVEAPLPMEGSVTMARSEQLDAGSTGDGGFVPTSDSAVETADLEAVAAEAEDSTDGMPDAASSASQPALSAAVADDTSAPIVGETDAVAAMEALPSEAAPTDAAEVAMVSGPPKTSQPTESLISKAMKASAPASDPVTNTDSTPAADRPAVDLQGVLSKAGLQLVNTDASKLESVRAETAHAASAVRPTRERKRTALPPQEPLAQVETRKH